MNWLSENYKRLFDGVGALVVMAVLGYVVRRILQGRSKGTAALTAQGAKVYVSPITRTSISWCELGERATEQDVVKCIEGLKKLSALISLARINISS